MDIAIIEQATGAVVSRVVIETLNGYDPGPGLIAIGVDGQAAYAGCTWSEQGGFVKPAQPPVDPAELKASLTAYAADVRWRKETGGIVAGGVPIATDDRSKQMIIGARIAADADPNWTTQWIAADGSIVPIDAAAIIAISDAVQAHVNDCFTSYALVKTDIDSGTITTTAEIDAAFAA